MLFISFRSNNNNTRGATVSPCVITTLVHSRLNGYTKGGCSTFGYNGITAKTCRNFSIFSVCYIHITVINRKSWMLFIYGIIVVYAEAKCWTARVGSYIIVPSNRQCDATRLWSVWIFLFRLFNGTRRLTAHLYTESSLYSGNGDNINCVATTRRRFSGNNIVSVSI